nr:hypothetical protein CFP56_53251 [Quercus suber]
MSVDRSAAWSVQNDTALQEVVASASTSVTESAAWSVQHTTSLQRNGRVQFGRRTSKLIGDLGLSCRSRQLRGPSVDMQPGRVNFEVSRLICSLVCAERYRHGQLQESGRVHFSRRISKLIEATRTST